MSTTRLVVLGAVREFQPVHGYFVRRELTARQVDEWANINPGSVYNALRVLTRDGFLEEVDTGGAGQPARTTYQLTAAGETEFLALLRAALRTVETFDPQPLLAALSFMTALPRPEVVDAFEQRIAEIDLMLMPADGAARPVNRRAPAPQFARELVELTMSRLEAEQEWARLLVKRLGNGEGAFADDG
jgi:DNA-binding PadR family transcriptional regulator